MSFTYTIEFKLGMDDLSTSAGAVNTFEMPEGVISTATGVVHYSVDDGNGGGATNKTIPVTYTGNGSNWSFTVPSDFPSGAKAVRVEVTQGRNFGDDAGLVSATATTRAWNEAPTVTVDQTTAGETKFSFGIPVGKQGFTGTSAYQQAVAEGFVGSSTDWLNSLKGTNGVNGKSAYELALDAGYKGSELDYLNSLKGQKGDKGDQGKSAYQVAFDAGFSGTEAEWLESLKAPALPVGGGYKELANGTLWYCRPRYQLSMAPNGYETAYNTTDFVIENGLYPDHGCYIPPENAVYPTNHMRLRTTRGVNRGVWNAGRMMPNQLPHETTTLDHFIDKYSAEFNGWYYVLLTPEASAQFSSDADLEKIEVDVQGVTFSGVNVMNANVTQDFYKVGREKGLLVPVYKGASRHITREDSVGNAGFTLVALWFRVGVYTHRSNIGADNHSFDGIEGEVDGWQLHDPDVKFWSTNVAQGMKFSAKIRN